MVFPYYARLSKQEQAVYRASDSRVTVPLPEARALRELVPDVEKALLADDRKAVQAATAQLVASLLTQIDAPPVVVKVLAVRPGDDESELHGLYEAVEGEVPELKVWMRTHAKKKPVAKKSFIRTVCHEICHHLDFFVYDLDPSFHTEGFFKRESHLARQLLVDPAASLGVTPPPAPATTPRKTRVQLGFDFE